MDGVGDSVINFPRHLHIQRAGTRCHRTSNYPLFRLYLLNDINLKFKQAFNSEFWFLASANPPMRGGPCSMCVSHNYTDNFRYSNNYNVGIDSEKFNHLHRHRSPISGLSVRCRAYPKSQIESGNFRNFNVFTLAFMVDSFFLWLFLEAEEC